jgi:hypothetical protein
VNTHISRSGKCAFVEYLSREIAENAARQLHNNLMIQNQIIPVNWSKPKGILTTDAKAVYANQDSTMLPPPGMENAPVSAYSLPGLSSFGAAVPPPKPPPLPNKTVYSSMSKDRLGTQATPCVPTFSSSLV